MKAQVRAADVVQQVHGTVQEMLASFAIKPSERINEVELAGSLGVSRTPLREALNRLSTEGLVSFVPNRGFFARSLGTEEVTNLFELRAGVEGIAVQAACQRASDAAIEELAMSWDRFLSRGCADDPVELAAADQQFHEALVALAGNTELDKVIHNINIRIRFVRQCAIEHPKRRKDTLSEHTKLVGALRQRDPVQARSLIEDHVAITAEDALDYITNGLARIYLKRPGSQLEPPR